MDLDTDCTAKQLHHLATHTSLQAEKRMTVYADAIRCGPGQMFTGPKLCPVLPCVMFYRQVDRRCMPSPPAKSASQNLIPLVQKYARGETLLICRRSADTSEGQQPHDWRQSVRLDMHILLSNKEGAICLKPDEICGQCQKLLHLQTHSAAIYCRPGSYAGLQSRLQDLLLPVPCHLPHPLTGDLLQAEIYSQAICRKQHADRLDVDKPVACCGSCM